MVEILVPKQSGEAVFLELTRDPKQLMYAMKRFHRSVSESFRKDGIFAPTSAMEKERVAIALKWFAIMRRDMKWSVERALDNIPSAIEAEKNGGTWDPPNGLWAAPGDEQHETETTHETSSGTGGSSF